MTPFGAQLRKIRKHKGLTQKQVADQLSVTIRAYQYYENGSRSPNLSKASQLASILGVSLDELSVRNCTTVSGTDTANSETA